MNMRFDDKTVEGFVERLVSTDRLSAGAGQRLTSAVDATGHPFDTVVIELGLMREEVLAESLADYLDTQYLARVDTLADREKALALGTDFFATRGMIPLSIGNETSLCVAVANPFDLDAREMLAYASGQPVAIYTATRNAIGAWFAALSTDTQGTVDGGRAFGDGVSESDLERLRGLAHQAPVVRLVSRVAQQAFDETASDIHIEPFEHEVRLRIRVDGSLKTIETVSASLLPGIVTRIKILAGLDISERRLPHDGRMRLAIRGQEIDLRVSTIPSVHGETIVLRLLDQSSVALDLAALGFDGIAREKLERFARLPNGIVLVTGPTGSGKTTTLYALLKILNNSDSKLITVEDPVEYRIHGVTQLQVNTSLGLTFARALRSVMRQNPNIILVGEIRDRETAEIAVQAALTGHLVLSTLHTNSAAGAVTRLRDMGIDDYLIGATLRGITAQRLLRRCCECNKAAPHCPDCAGSGFRGRTVTYEIAEVTERASRLISSGNTEDVVASQLVGDGMIALKEHAQALVKSRKTTAEEVARVIRLNGSDWR